MADSNPSLRPSFMIEIVYLLTILLTCDLLTNGIFVKKLKMLTSVRKLLTKKLKLSISLIRYE